MSQRTKATFKSAAIVVLFVLLLVVFLKFSLIINNPQSYCAFGPFAHNCNNQDASYNDYYQTLRNFSRALPLVSLIFLLASISAVALLAKNLLEVAERHVSKTIFINRDASFNLALAQKPILQWMELHEAGSPAADR